MDSLSKCQHSAISNNTRYSAVFLSGLSLQVPTFCHQQQHKIFSCVPSWTLSPSANILPSATTQDIQLCSFVDSLSKCQHSAISNNTRYSAVFLRGLSLQVPTFCHQQQHKIFSCVPSWTLSPSANILPSATTQDIQLCSFVDSLSKCQHSAISNNTRYSAVFLRGLSLQVPTFCHQQQHKIFSCVPSWTLSPSANILPSATTQDIQLCSFVDSLSKCQHSAISNNTRYSAVFLRGLSLQVPTFCHQQQHKIFSCVPSWTLSPSANILPSATTQDIQLCSLVDSLTKCQHSAISNNTRYSAVFLHGLSLQVPTFHHQHNVHKILNFVPPSKALCC